MKYSIFLCSLLTKAVFGAEGEEYTNVAFNKPTSLSSQYNNNDSQFGSANGVDGFHDYAGHWDMVHSAWETSPWWEVELLDSYDINKIIVYNRPDCCSERIDGFRIEIMDGTDVVYTYNREDTMRDVMTYEINVANIIGDKVRFSLPGQTGYMNFMEVEVYGKTPSLNPRTDGDGGFNINAAGAFGDPHVKAWNGEQFDFHGVCDLVLARNPKFGNGVGLDMHIRSKRMSQWSFVGSAVVRIGKDSLEVRGGKITKFWINGIEGNVNTEKLAISGYPIKYQCISEKSGKFVVDLGNDEAIVFKTWHSFVSIMIEKPKLENFAGSVGLMGSFPEGLKIGRENSIIEDINAFGQEWQVLSTEQNLFHNIEGPQHPEICDVPSSLNMRRHLQESLMTIEQAEKACIDVALQDKELCIFDVIATNDESAAGAY